MDAGFRLLARVLAFVLILTLLLCAPRVGMGIGMAIGVLTAIAPSCGGGCGVSGPCVWLPGIPKSAEKTESSPHAKGARFAPHAIEGRRDGRPPLLLPAIRSLDTGALIEGDVSSGEEGIASLNHPQ